MTALVTGGSGFIGSRLIDELLSAGHSVRSLDKVPSREHPELATLGDVRRLEAVIQACDGAATIYHLAAEHRDDVTPISLYRDVNVEGAKNIVAAAKRASTTRIVFTSTVAVYGLRNPTAWEDAAPAPFNEYGRTKLEAERIFRAWAREDPARSLTIVRPCVVFGEGNRGNVYTLLSQIHARRFIMIGSGKNKKSMAYVGNIALYLAALCNAPPGIQVLNYADKPDMSTGELVDLARERFGRRSLDSINLPYSVGMLIGYSCDAVALVLGRPLPVSSVRVRKFCADTTVSTERLDAQGFCRPYSLRDGLVRMIESEFSLIASARGPRQV